MEKLEVKSSAFEEGGWIPLRNSAYGENFSPDFTISGIAPNAKSIAITLDDASHPIFPNYNHWLIWNIPIQARIPEGIPKGKYIDGLGDAIQGIAYGRHRYKGPKPPQNSIHTYVFTIYILDCSVELSAGSRKRKFMTKMEGHVLQQFTLSGKFKKSKAVNSEDYF